MEVLTFQDAALGTAHVTVLAAFATLLLWQRTSAYITVVLLTAPASLGGIVAGGCIVVE